MDPNTFDEFLDFPKHIDHNHLFETNKLFKLKEELVWWARQTARKVNTYLIIIRYNSKIIINHRPYVNITIECECRETLKQKAKGDKVPVKRRVFVELQSINRDRPTLGQGGLVDPPSCRNVPWDRLLTRIYLETGYPMVEKERHTLAQKVKEEQEATEEEENRGKAMLVFVWNDVISLRAF